MATKESGVEGADQAGAPRVFSVKLLPPKVPPWYIRRPALEERLDAAADYRLTAILAGAGYGKSTHTAARANANGWAWYTLGAEDRSPVTLARGLTAALRRSIPTLSDALIPEGSGGEEGAVADSLAAALAYALEEELTDDVVLVVDDVQELGRDAAGARVLDALLRYAPPQLHLVLSSRDDPPFSVARLRGRGAVLDIGGSDLAFTHDDVAAWLAHRLDAADEALASELHAATGGWPVAVQLATDVLTSIPAGERRDAVRSVTTRRGPLFGYLAEEVLGREPPEVTRVLQVAAQFDRVSPDLCETLGIENASDLLDALARRGLVSEPPAGAEQSYAPHALVREFIQAAWPTRQTELRELRRRAAEWFESRGALGDALRELTAAGDVAAIARFFEKHGAALLDQAEVGPILGAAEVLPEEMRSASFAFVVAQAYTLRGELERARVWLSAWRTNSDSFGFGFQRALIHIHRHEPRDALAALLGDDSSGPPSAMHQSFVAYQLLSLGEIDEARRHADLAFAAVRSPEWPEPTAFAETEMLAAQLAMFDGDVTAAHGHLIDAIASADELGNVLATCAARTSLVWVLVVQGRFAEAIDEGSRALELAARFGISLFQGWTPAARGEAFLGIGRLDEAMADFAAALAVDERLQSNAVTWPLTRIGDVHRERGEPAQARVAYERALAAAERAEAPAEIAAARAGLARVVADDEPDEAMRLAETAVVGAPNSDRMGTGGAGVNRIGTLLALGWVALCVGRRDRAREAAAEAVDGATRRSTPALLAESLELTGVANEDDAALEEAVTLWRTLGNPLGEARALLARLSLGADVSQAEREHAEQTLRDLGVRRSGIATGALAMLGPELSVPLAVETLGRFAVWRRGNQVEAGEWQSKKARDLLKLLVARRGQTTTRDFLVEALWPEEDPGKTSNRLSVALNVIRNVLDPEHEHDAGHYVISTADGVRLDLTHVTVDVEAFLRHASDGRRLLRAGETDEAVRLLESAESAYRGDFLEEDRYEDWAAPLRDEARTTYIEVARTLAVEGRDGIRYRLRILALDPYDEDAHLGLVGAQQEAGMHGEARRAFRRYVSRMNEIGVEPAPFPGR